MSCTAFNIIHVIKNSESKNSLISYITINNQNYIIKQKKNSKKISLILDALASYIVQDLHIAHTVTILPSVEKLSDQISMTGLAILCTLAPGVMVRDLPDNHKYSGLCLKQRGCGNIHNQWLTESLINNMTWHKQLPVIIAIDIFIANSDRHSGNIFYDEKTDSFCAIDMDNIFKFDIPAKAIEKLIEMIEDGKVFTKEEIKALKKVKKILILLLEKYPAQKIINQLYIIIKEAGIDVHQYDSRIDRIKNTIHNNQKSIVKLIALLESIIKEN